MLNGELDEALYNHYKTLGPDYEDICQKKDWPTDKTLTLDAGSFFSYLALVCLPAAKRPASWQMGSVGDSLQGAGLCASFESVARQRGVVSKDALAKAAELIHFLPGMKPGDIMHVRKGDDVKNPNTGGLWMYLWTMEDKSIVALNCAPPCVKLCSFSPPGLENKSQAALLVKTWMAAKFPGCDAKFGAKGYDRDYSIVLNSRWCPWILKGGPVTDPEGLQAKPVAENLARLFGAIE
ncbi:hypothetical protein FACS1894198_5630 [Clostridia bacterium]|nr:hypothetical protein FACS1894198_5630 [Clostridia bacterium]